MMRMALATARQSAAFLGASLPWMDGRLAWRELENKLNVFNLFEHVEWTLDAPPPGGGFALGELLAQAGRKDDYTGLWIAEGLGHRHAERSWEEGRAPRRLLLDHRLPERAMVALHAGMGLSFASRALERLDLDSSGPRLRAALGEFVDLCKRNSRPGCLEAAIEPLGLAVRTLRPWLALPFDRELARVDRRLPGLFWHGVGRGIYFIPTNFVPWTGAWERALELAEREPPHQQGRLNALAGLCWALTLVNVRSPGVVEAFVQRHGGRLAQSPAFSNGAGSALIVWRHWAGEGAEASLLGHRPEEPGVARSWEALLRRPAQQALRKCYPPLRRGGRFGELFRFQPLSQLAARLERGAARGQPFRQA